MARVEFSVSVRSQAYERAGGCCEHCGLPIGGERPEYHHRIPWEISRDSSLSNAVCLHKRCHREITRSDIKTIAKGRRIRRKRSGIDKPGRFPTNRKGPYKRRMDGTIEKRR